MVLDSLVDLPNCLYEIAAAVLMCLGGLWLNFAGFVATGGPVIGDVRLKDPVCRLRGTREFGARLTQPLVFPGSQGQPSDSVEAGA